MRDLSFVPEGVEILVFAILEFGCEAYHPALKLWVKVKVPRNRLEGPEGVEV
jgi:hypothetical protein